MRSIVLAAAFLAFSSVTLSGAAQAHAKLEAAQPPIGGTVTAAPSELDLKFSEALDLKFTGIMVTGPDNKEITTGNAVLVDGGKTFGVSLPAGLAAGIYKVEWHVLSRDGHKTHGEYKFTVKP